jgi:hypothetical protein
MKEYFLLSLTSSDSQKSFFTIHPLPFFWAEVRGSLDWINLRIGDHWLTCEHNKEPSGSINAKHF